MIVILDNGHGAETKGKRSPAGIAEPQILEYAYTRRVVAELKRIYTEQGRGDDVVVLVPEESDVSLVERVARANKLHRIAKNCGKDGAVLISVHLNAYDYSDKPRGWEVHSSGSKASDRLALDANRIAHEVLAPMGVSMRGVKTSPFYIIKYTAMPAILTENCFMSNAADCAFLNSEDGFKAIVEMHKRLIDNVLTK